VDPAAFHGHDVESAFGPGVAEPRHQVQLRRAAYFAALSCIYAGRGIAGPPAAPDLDENPARTVAGHGIDLARTVAHIARFDTQAARAQVGTGTVFCGRTLALGRAGTDREGGGWGPAQAALQAMLAAMTSIEDPAGGAQADAWSGQFPWDAAGLAQQEFAPGLYVVATPLGNAADVTLRALWVLRSADCIAVEDTRTTAPLLARFGIRNRLLALHQHNEAERTPEVLERLLRGERVALVSDAGTPAISDPGAVLVRAARAAGVRVIPVPGASSLTAALSVAGVRAAEIRFVGFAPGRSQARKRHWRAIAAADAAVVVFEAPHRIAATAAELAAALEPDRPILVARELTKKFETLILTTAEQLPEVLGASAPRGEYVLVIDAPAGPDGADADAGDDPAGAPPIDPLSLRWLLALAAEMPASRAAAIASKVTGLPRAQLYRALGHRDRAE
jgi:16S rRNA (cytidine1402-2'-O)-methyltransferase